MLTYVNPHVHMHFHVNSTHAHEATHTHMHTCTHSFASVITHLPMFTNILVKENEDAEDDITMKTVEGTELFQSYQETVSQEVQAPDVIFLGAHVLLRSSAGRPLNAAVLEVTDTY